MNVLYITTAFPRYEGDVITPWLVETIKRIKNKGINVDVFTSSYKGIGNQKLYGIDVYRFRYFFSKWENLTHEETAPDRVERRTFYKILSLLYIIGGIIGIIKLCKKKKYKIIHVHWPFPHGLFGYFAKKIGNANKMISSFHGVELRWVKTRKKMFLPFIKWVIKKSDVVTANSTYTAKEIPKSTQKIYILPFGATVDIKKGKQGNKDRNILFVGRLVERKGVKYLISAFNIVAKEIKDVKLIIVGEGPERKELEKMVKSNEKVVFKGKISKEELEECYQNCSVFVLPACIDSKGDTEGLGVVLIEAMSYKKPVVASNVGGITDIIKHNETGILVPEKDYKELASAIIKILKDDKLANKLAMNGYNFVKEKYSWQKIIDKLIKIYSL